MKKRLIPTHYLSGISLLIEALSSIYFGFNIAVFTMKIINQ